MNKSMKTTHFGIYGIAFNKDQDKILLVKKTRGPYTGLYDLPGGTPEKDESYDETLIREFLEEVGTQINLESDWIDLKFLVERDSFNQHIHFEHSAKVSLVCLKDDICIEKLSEDTSGASWVNVEDVHLMSSLVKEALKRTHQKTNNRNIKIHIFGASGSGVSTLGRALAIEFQIPFFDSDDYYWKQTDPPFVEANPIDERKSLLKNAVADNKSWVVSGTLVSWGDVIQDEFDFAVYLSVPSEERILRLKKREAERFGSRIEVGGDMHEAHLKFLDWAAQYDEGYMGGRSKAKHEVWMKTLNCTVLRIKGIVSLEEALSKVVEYITVNQD